MNHAYRYYIPALAACSIVALPLVARGDEAEIRRVIGAKLRGAAMTLTISHGPLHTLGMAPMTMGFRVDDARPP